MTAGQLRGLLRGLPANTRVQFIVYVPADCSDAYDEKGRRLNMELVMDGGVELDPEPATEFSMRFTEPPAVMHVDDQ